MIERKMMTVHCNLSIMDIWRDGYAYEADVNYSDIKDAIMGARDQEEGCWDPEVLPLMTLSEIWYAGAERAHHVGLCLRSTWEGKYSNDT